MAFHKLRVFHLVQFRKLLWLDSDTIVFHNIDHLLLLPTLTAAVVQKCLRENSPGTLAGGTWVVEPSWGVFHYVESLYSNPVPGTNPPEGWSFGDMQVVAHAFGQPQDEFRSSTNLPFTLHVNQGIIPGLREFVPQFRDMTEEQWREFVFNRIPAFHAERVKQLNGSLPPTGPWPIPGQPPSDRPVWHMLDWRYEYLTGNCVMDGAKRDIGPDWYTVHFTCMSQEAVMQKPSAYSFEQELLADAMTKAPPCLRYYVLRWYEIYKRGMGARLPPPYYNGTQSPPASQSSSQH